MNELAITKPLRANRGMLRVYDQACKALAAAVTVDEFRDVIDVAAALKGYAKKAKNLELEADAFELRARAERGVGLMMAAQAETIGRAKGIKGRFMGGVTVTPPEDAPSLAAAGIDKNLAKQARMLRELNEGEFEALITQGRERIIHETNRMMRRIVNVAARNRTQQRSVDPVDGKHRVIVIDPPWPMEKIERDVRRNQVGFEYPAMTEDELEVFPVAEFAAADCHFFCWATQRFLPMALRLIDIWGFNYVCDFVWHKPGGFQPVGLPQYNCEFIVYARSGAPRFIDTKDFPTCFGAPRREHSRKPDEFYDMVRRVTDGPRIDVFSREKRDGFHQYGNETAKFAVAP